MQSLTPAILTGIVAGVVPLIQQTHSKPEELLDELLELLLDSDELLELLLDSDELLLKIEPEPPLPSEPLPDKPPLPSEPLPDKPPLPSEPLPDKPPLPSEPLPDKEDSLTEENDLLEP